MGATTGISWADATFNPVWGCAKVSPACDNCYAETFARRLDFKVWGTAAPRREFGDKYWAQPRKWNTAAAAEGVRRRVFCASMADVFDSNWPEGVRDRLWALIRETPHLDWMLLTKRIENAVDMLPPDWEREGFGYPNVWLGVTAENQKLADDRISWLRTIPATVRFVSCEPALEHIDFTRLMVGIHQIIIGGESGSKARFFDPAWARSLIAQCKGTKVVPFVKQLGERWAFENRAKSLHGAEPSEWPEDLRVQEFPR